MQVRGYWQDNNSAKGISCTCSAGCQASSSQLRIAVVSLSQMGIESQLGRVSWCFGQDSKSQPRIFQKQQSSLVSCTMCLQRKQCNLLSLTSQSCPGKCREDKQ